MSTTTQREIKFRAWGGQEKEHYEFVYFSLLAGGIESDCVVADDPDETGGRPTLDLEDIVAVHQYTGLKDRNGKEIYEGDILQWSARDIDNSILRQIDIVAWEKGSFVTLEPGDTVGFSTETFFDPGNRDQIRKQSKVIGNIYENPELLTDHKNPG